MQDARDLNKAINEEMEVADMGVTFDYNGKVLTIEKTKMGSNNTKAKEFPVEIRDEQSSIVGDQ